MVRYRNHPGELPCLGDDVTRDMQGLSILHSRLSAGCWRNVISLETATPSRIFGHKEVASYLTNVIGWVQYMHLLEFRYSSVSTGENNSYPRILQRSWRISQMIL